MDLIYINQNKPLGLGHAIKCAKPEVGKKPFAVVLPDRVVDGSESTLKKLNLAKLKKFFLKTNSNCMLLSEIPINEVNKFGIIKPKNKKNKNIL